MPQRRGEAGVAVARRRPGRRRGPRPAPPGARGARRRVDLGRAERAGGRDREQPERACTENEHARAVDAAITAAAGEQWRIPCTADASGSASVAASDGEAGRETHGSPRSGTTMASANPQTGRKRLRAAPHRVARPARLAGSTAARGGRLEADAVAGRDGVDVLADRDDARPRPRVRVRPGARRARAARRAQPWRFVAQMPQASTRSRASPGPSGGRSTSASSSLPGGAEEGGAHGRAGTDGGRCAAAGATAIERALGFSPTPSDRRPSGASWPAPGVAATAIGARVDVARGGRARPTPPAIVPPLPPLLACRAAPSGRL